MKDRLNKDKFDFYKRQKNENTDFKLPPIITAGEGEPLVFLHGFGSSKEAFLAQIKFFSARYKVFAPDLTGFGENAFMSYPYSLADYAEEFYKLLNFIGEPHVYLIAHSFGCRIAFKALTESIVIKKAVLVGAAGLKPKRSFAYRLKKVCYKFLKPFVNKSVLEKKFFSPDYNTLSPLKKQSFKLILSETFDEKLQKIDVPILAVFGENDKETPPYFAQRIVKNVKGAQKYIMKGCGHFCFVESPHEFNLIANEFLS